MTESVITEFTGSQRESISGYTGTARAGSGCWTAMT